MDGPSPQGTIDSSDSVFGGGRDLSADYSSKVSWYPSYVPGPCSGCRDGANLSHFYNTFKLIFQIFLGDLSKSTKTDFKVGTHGGRQLHSDPRRTDSSSSHLRGRFGSVRIGSGRVSVPPPSRCFGCPVRGRVETRVPG